MATIDKASVFATGPSGTSGLDSLTTTPDGSIWAEYGNGASSSGGPGSSTIVHYGPDGALLGSQIIAGSVDGLKTDPVTGQIWALINQDGNSKLSLIDPATGAMTTPLSYAVTSTMRGYDDAAFTGGQVYMSYTNPQNPGDPVLQQLDNGNMPLGTLTLTNLLSLGDTGTNIATGKTEAIPLSDPDSLKSISGGRLVLTSGADNAFTIVNDPGTKAQSERFVSLTNLPAGSSLDDVIVPTSSSGTFYVSNPGTSQLEAYKVSGLNTSDAYASVGTEIVQVDLQTGAQTVLVSGLKASHGLVFTPDSVAGPVVQSTSIFATGAEASGATAPDSVTLGGGSVWVEYGNGADSTGLLPNQGSSTIVQYDMQGRTQHTYSLPGSIDGLKYDPASGQVFALKNQDGNSHLYTIDPNTQSVSGPLDYAPPYAYGNAPRGFDDVAFQGGNVYLSYTAPANPGDSVIAQLDQGNDPSGALTLTSIVRLGDTGTNLATGEVNQPLPVADPDSLKMLANGSLILTSDHDASLTIVANPGTAQQSASFVTLPAGSSGLDDAIVPTADAGTFYVSNGGANNVLKVAVTGLNQNDIYVSVGSDNAVDQLDPTTGKLTPFIVGLNSPHGMEFVPSDGSTPVASGASGSGFANLVTSLAPSLAGDLAAGQLNQLATYASQLAQGGSNVQPPLGGPNFAAVTQIADQLKTLFAPHTA